MFFVYDILIYNNNILCLLNMIKLFKLLFLTHLGRFITLLTLLPVFEYLRDNLQNSTLSKIFEYLTIICMGFVLLYAFIYIIYACIIKPLKLRKYDNNIQKELKNKYK